MFKIGTQYIKAEEYYNHAIIVKSLLCLTDPKEARQRREAMGSYFSKASIRRLEPILLENIDKLVGRFEDSRDSGKSINASYAYRCLTADVITTYSYDKSFGALETPDLRPQFLIGFEEAVKSSVIQQFFVGTINALIKLANKLPRSVTKMLNTTLYYTAVFEDVSLAI